MIKSKSNTSLIPDPLCSIARHNDVVQVAMDLGSVINDCETKHYNIGRDSEKEWDCITREKILPYVA